MKQRITVEQLKQLTLEQQKKLRDWWKPHKWDVYINFEEGHTALFTFANCLLNIENGKLISITGLSLSKSSTYPLFSIGQCIEFLREYDLDIHDNWNEIGKWSIILNKSINNYWIEEISSEELIDALWETMLKVLEHQI